MDRQDEGTTEGLARKAAARDPEAFEQLAGRLHGRLTMWISVRMGPLLRARLGEEDVLQETLLQAYRSLDGFKPGGPDSFRKWIFSVAENRIRDLHKYHAAQKRDPAREAQPAAGPAPASSEERDLLERISASGTSPSSGAWRRELVERMVAGIDKLDEPLREVLVARVIEELPFKEIAKRVKRRSGDIPALYARAVACLNDELNPSNG